MRGYDYEVVGDKIAEMVGDFYEHELEIRDAEIKRLRQEVEKLESKLSWICGITNCHLEDELIEQKETDQ